MVTNNETIKKIEKGKDGRPYIVKGYVDSRDQIDTKFGGYAWRIKINGCNYYLNSSVEKTGDFFAPGKVVAFTVVEKGKWLLIKQIFYLFNE